jgi:Flp pilus assembly protein TadG
MRAFRIGSRIRTRRELASDRGAVAVEAALIIPVIILILFGIIEFALLLRDYVALTSATRTGTRMASAEPRMSAFADDAVAAVARAGTAMPASSIQEMWVYKANADGLPGTESKTVGAKFVSCSANCLRYTYNASTKSFTAAGGSWSYTSINACASESTNMTSVGVYIKAQHAWFTKLFGSNVSMGEHAVMRFEPMPELSSTGSISCK